MTVYRRFVDCDSISVKLYKEKLNMLSLSTIGLAATSHNIFDIGAGLLLGLFLLGLIVYIFFAVCMSKIFVKAGKPGWAGYVPVYSTWVLYEIGGLPGWLALFSLLLAIPFLNILVGIGIIAVDIIVALEIAKRFGRSSAFAIVLLFLFPWIGYPMLAFGKSQYTDPTAGGAPTPLATPPGGAYPPQQPINPSAPPPPPAVTPPIVPQQPQPPVVNPSQVIQPTTPAPESPQTNLPPSSPPPPPAAPTPTIQ
jgi:hypothetical protein